MTITAPTPPRQRGWPKPIPLADRFWKHVDKNHPSGCWLWMGAKTADGYGHIHVTVPRQMLLRAHRVAYELVVGPIPEGLTLDHLCRVRLCVNPAHLEPVTSSENVLRGDTVTGRNARKTHCVNGHEFTRKNTILVKGGRVRRCRLCHNTYARRRYEASKAVAA